MRPEVLSLTPRFNGVLMRAAPSALVQPGKARKVALSGRHVDLISSELLTFNPIERLVSLFMVSPKSSRKGGR
jgi:hypothetical protein